MFPYQLSRVLADERMHDMVAVAERRERMAAARHQHRDLAEPLPRLRAVAAQISRTMALLSGRRGVRASSTATSATSATSAGPMGCAA